MKTLKVSRKITSANLRIEELKKWLGKEVEIIIVEKEPVSKKEAEPSSVAGILERFKNPDLMEKEETGWTIAVEEKYGNR